MIKAVGWREESSLTLLSTTRKYDPNLSFAGPSSRDVFPNISQPQLSHLWLGTIWSQDWMECRVLGLEHSSSDCRSGIPVAHLTTNSLLFNMHAALQIRQSSVWLGFSFASKLCLLQIIDFQMSNWIVPPTIDHFSAISVPQQPEWLSPGAFENFSWYPFYSCFLQSISQHSSQKDHVKT